MLAALLLATPAVAQDGWERLVPDFAPLMAACLEDRPGAMVIHAHLPPGARLEALTLLPDGRQESCVADLIAGRVIVRDVLRPEHHGAGPHLRAFMLDRRCVDARRVDGADGREIGWLAYPGCG